MSKQAIIELLTSNAAKYRKSHSRKAKGELLKQLMELTGYKSSKSIIRYYSRTRRRRGAEKRGSLPKLHPCRHRNYKVNLVEIWPTLRLIFLPQNDNERSESAFWGRKMVDLPCFLVNYRLEFRWPQFWGIHFSVTVFFEAIRPEHLVRKNRQATSIFSYRHLWPVDFNYGRENWRTHNLRQKRRGCQAW